MVCFPGTYVYIYLWFSQWLWFPLDSVTQTIYVCLSCNLIQYFVHKQSDALVVDIQSHQFLSVPIKNGPSRWKFTRKPESHKTSKLAELGRTTKKSERFQCVKGNSVQYAWNPFPFAHRKMYTKMSKSLRWKSEEKNEWTRKRAHSCGSLERQSNALLVFSLSSRVFVSVCVCARWFGEKYTRAHQPSQRTRNTI